MPQSFQLPGQSIADFVDATDLPPINVGVGGFGLGAPASSMAGYGVPNFFYQGVNSEPGDLPPIGPSAPAGGLLPNNLTQGTGATPASPDVGGTTNPNKTNVQSATTQGTLQDWFFRILIVILGFICVAIGLSMFRHGDNVGEATERLRRGMSK